MPTLAPAPRPPLVRPGPTRPGRGAVLVAAVGSTALAGWAVAALAGAVQNPYANGDFGWISTLLSPTATAWLALALGVLGLAGAPLGRSRGAGARRAVGAVALLEVLGAGIALQSVETIALAGYLVALALPVGLVGLSVQVVRRYRRVRWLVLVGWAALLVVGGSSDVLAPRHLAALAAELATGFARQSASLVVVLLLALVTAAWVAVATPVLRGSTGLVGLQDWVLRHRTGLTLLAAAGPLPYGLIRASWLTPWPLLSPSEEVLTPEIRVWGLLLGGGALLGAVLTVGLIRPWGSVFPRWMPWLGGRPVPPAAAVVPGGLVAGLVTASALPMLFLITVPPGGTVFGGLSVWDRVAALLIFPFGVWGPALALAVLGYAVARSRSTTPAAARD